jgi:hypothetical protein
MAASPTPPAAATKPHYFADLYSFDWTDFSLRLPLVSASAVAICLFTGILAGHPAGGLIAGGGAFTIGFGPNQRISDSRLLPMIAAIFSTATATLVGTLAGHHSSWLVLAAAVSAFIYGILTARETGVSWVGQQASVALLVASAFPSGPELAFQRAGLIAAGGTLQLLITSAGLRLIPALGKDLSSIASSLYSNIRQLSFTFPAFTRLEAFSYALRLCLTVALAAEIYHLSGIQSGYWIPMTALIVQKPAFFETLTRASGRVLGTLAGAWLGSLLIAHIVPSPVVLAATATVFALCAFATISVNYGLFSVFLTGYIVFLLSLNQIPGPVIAHRRALCTILGGLIAILFHIEAVTRIHRRRQAPTAI